jgi:GNAT superfamily N-acetyltransferase
MPAEHESLAVRPPWADELPRLKPFFRDEPLVGPWRLFTLVAPNPERILGAAALKAVGERVELRCQLRPRAQSEGRGKTLLEAALASARESGLKRVTSRPPAGSPQEKFLRAHGFIEFEAEEIWRVDLAALKNRLEPLTVRIQKSSDYSIRAPGEKDLPKLTALFGSHRLGSAAQICVRSTTNPGGFDNEISSVIEDSSGRLLAALLGRGSNSLNCRATLCATANNAPWASGSLFATVLQRGISEARAQGYLTVSFTVNPARDISLRNLARRANGALMRTVHLLAYEL